MDQGNVLPRGGFTRGMLAGITFVLVVFVAASTFSPLPTLETDSVVASIPDSDPFAAIVSSQFGAGSISEDSQVSSLVSPSIASSPRVTPSAPTSFNAPSSGTAPSAGESAPVSGVSLTAPAASLSPVTIERLNETAPLVVVPILAPDSTESITAPDVNVETEVAGVAIPSVSTNTQNTVQPTNLSSGTDNSNDVSVAAGESADVPTGGFDDVGQGIVSPTEQTGSSEVSNTTSGPAFETFSVTFTDFIDKPYISIILLAETLEETQAVIDLGGPVTLAVLADNPLAQDIITTYRRGGGEVVLMLPNEGPFKLRKGDDPLLVSSVLELIFENGLGVIGILDGPSGDLNQDSNMVKAVIEVIKQSGHALITTTSLGLNRAEGLVDEAGLPGTSITRHLDVAPGKVTVIRAMDRAILQLESTASNTVFGTASSDTIAALSFWYKSRKAQAITIAPVSASIKRN